MLRKDAVACVACTDLERLATELERGAAAVLVAEEALPHDSRLIDLIQRQPPWSDLPVLVLTRPGADSAAGGARGRARWATSPCSSARCGSPRW